MFQEFENFSFFNRFFFLICMVFVEYLGLIGNTLSQSFQCDRESKTHGWVKLLILTKNNTCFVPKKLFCSQQYPWTVCLYKNIDIMVLNHYCSELVHHEM